MKKKARVIAFYLPQFHPIPENDAWWGKGFTEWTNVAKAKPLFRGHYQPRIPADLGFYDLRLSQVREQQAELATKAGIEGFCYWHYWFGKGKQLLETPFNEVLKTGKPDFPFCLGWANHSWTNKSWDTGKKFAKVSTIIEQQYPGLKEHEEHFYHLLPAFNDSRYITVDNKPLFVIFMPFDIPQVENFIDLWNNLAIKEGLKGIYFVGIAQNMDSLQWLRKKKQLGIINREYKNTPRECYDLVLKKGFAGVNSRGIYKSEILSKPRILRYAIKAVNIILDGAIVDQYRYKKIIKNLYVEEDTENNIYPTIIPNWDRSPRSGKKAIIWHDSTPELFYNQVERAITLLKNKPDQHKILFLQSWNEWAEGNYMEPDLKFGCRYIEELKRALTD